MMTYKRGTVDYEVNLNLLHEMEELVPMTVHERECLRNWARQGHDVETNPWDFYEPDGSSMNYLKARRIECGSSRGPWDDWGNDIPYVWDKMHRQLIIL